jgi:CheY-like chemotaxis protein
VATIQPIALVLEDNEFVSVSTEVQLEDLGFRTLSAASAEAALEHLRKDRTIELFVADLAIGEDLTAGLVVALEAVTLQPDLAVIYMSGRTPSDEERSGFVKRSGFLSKPFTARQLKASIEALLDAKARPDVGDPAA